MRRYVMYVTLEGSACLNTNIVYVGCKSLVQAEIAL